MYNSGQHDYPARISKPILPFTGHGKGGGYPLPDSQPSPLPWSLKGVEMPTRLIKESIWTSRNYNRMSMGARLHFILLLPATDDWGCFEAAPEILKGQCYPFQEATSIYGESGSIESWNAELAVCKLVKFWKKGERLYGQLLTWEEHNDLTYRRETDIPCPPWMLDKNGLDSRMSTKRFQCYQRIADATETIVEAGKKPTYREIQLVAKCSPRDVSSYRKYKENHEMLPDATDVTETTLDIDIELEADIEEEEVPTAPKKSKADEWKFELAVNRLFDSKFPDISHLQRPLKSEIGKKTLGAIRLRAKEREWTGIGPWNDLFDSCSKSSFLMSESFFSLYWLTRPTNMEKVEMGNYKDKAKVKFEPKEQPLLSLAEERAIREKNEQS